MSGGGVSSVWLMSAGGSLPWLLGKDGDDGEGQENYAGCASDHQTQDAAVHLHGLTALSRVEEGMTGDTPAARHPLHVHTDAFILARVRVTWVSEVLWPVVVLHRACVLH